MAPEKFILTLEAIALLAVVGIFLAKKIFNTALFFLTVMLCLAGIYGFAGSTYLFIVQLAVYGGGIAVLVLFAVMITGKKFKTNTFPVSIWNLLPAVLVLALLLANLKSIAPSAISERETDSVLIGNYLSDQYLVAFGFAGFLLLVAMVGAIIVAVHKPENHGR
ncbi:MAG: NADH-quinone oxidoreductase subunit J [Bacteroidetes bacterium]|nr:NADH-quinone oxidoreductase subunit J [Bacteroidota bacterium]